VLGDSIDVKVSASNLYGQSDYSPIGSGAQIVLIPAAPESFSNVAEETTASHISLSWDEPTETGGEAIIDYRIY
jgi:hypothetical protein